MKQVSDPLSDPLTTAVDICDRTVIGGNLYTVDISSTTYPLCLVNIVCEWPY